MSGELLRNLTFLTFAVVVAIFRYPFVSAGLSQSRFWGFSYTDKTIRWGARGVLVFSAVMIVFTLLDMLGIVDS